MNINLGEKVKNNSSNYNNNTKINIKDSFHNKDNILKNKYENENKNIKSNNKKDIEESDESEEEDSNDEDSEIS